MLCSWKFSDSFHTNFTHQSQNCKDLELFYPVIEDAVGKHTGPYSEYLFLEYRNNIEYDRLESTDYFRWVLRDRAGNPVLLQDVDIEKVRKHVLDSSKLDPGDQVIVLSGPMRGSIGIVLALNKEFDQVHLEVSMGDESIDTIIPNIWLRKRGKSNKIDIHKRRVIRDVYLEKENLEVKKENDDIKIPTVPS